MKNIESNNDLKEKFISKREVINICNKLRNTQDKILIYATYNGISGNKLEDLRNLKYSDFDLVENIVNVNNEEIKIDIFFQRLIEEGKSEEVYYINNGNVANGVKNKFKINQDSEYVLRGKPTLVNNNGVDPIGYPSLQSRIKIISEIVGVNITYNKLYRSKVVEEMCLLKQNWRHKEVEEYLKNNQLRFKATNILSLINEVVETGILNNNFDLSTSHKKRISEFKLTMYQEEAITGLYKVVAGLSMVNEIQKRKIENEFFKVVGKNITTDLNLKDSMNSLIEVDKIYWELIINEQFNEEEQEYLIKIYANKEQYERQNERYYISYINGEYSIFTNLEYKGPGERDDLMVDLYSSSECTNIISRVIDDFNEVNKVERELIIKNISYDKKDKERLTPPYLNDIGLDMLLVLNSSVEFRMAKVAFGICEKLEVLKEINKATPCIDVSTDGEIFIAIIKGNGAVEHLKLESSYSIKVLRSLGKKCRYIEFDDIDGVIEYFSEIDETKNYLNLKVLDRDIKLNIEKLKEMINLSNENLEEIDEIDEFLKIKNKDYLHYYQRDESEVIFSMYDYDLLIEYNVLEEAYIVKRYIELKGTIEKVFDVFKTRDVEELVKWLAEVKANSYENIDYSMFLVN